MKFIECQAARIEWRIGVRDRAKELRGMGLSQATIAGMLTDEGYLSVTGCKIDQPIVSRLLSGTKVNQDMGGS